MHMRTQSGLPYVTWTGGLVAVPELRFTPGGLAVAEIRLAGKKRTKDATGQYVDGDPIYLSVTAWRTLAENAAETLTRPGQRVTVTGDLEQQWYEKEGVKQSKFVIVADTLSVDLTFHAYDEKDSAKKTAAGPTGAADPWGAPPQTEEPPF
jgi:single-strand DNA-binding protein